MFTSATIDTFNRSEDPLSDSGKWVQWYVSDPTDRSILIVNNDLVNPTAFSLSFHAYGISVRQSSPGASGDQEVFYALNGAVFLGEALHLVVRGDLNKNGYVASIPNGSRTSYLLEKWSANGATKTLLASTTTGPELFPGSDTQGQLGMRAIGSTISFWANPGILPGTGWQQVLSATDTTYASGFVGIGTGMLEPDIQYVSGGEVQGPGRLGVWINPEDAPTSKHG